jgi:hypothetical protein
LNLAVREATPPQQPFVWKNQVVGMLPNLAPLQHERKTNEKARILASLMNTLILSVTFVMAFVLAPASSKSFTIPV